MKKHTIEVDGTPVTLFQQNEADYVSLTDMAKTTNARPEIPIQTWLRSKSTIEFIHLWEQLHNPNFNHSNFAVINERTGSNSFYLSPTQWVNETNAIGILSKRGRYGGTYAHHDIAMEFASWLSPRFKLYLIKEFRQLQEKRYKELGWTVSRILTKANHHIHTDSVRMNRVPVIDWNTKREAIYHASELDILNLAVFGMTAKEWKLQNPERKGNMRDHATYEQLIVLANLNAINVALMRENIDKQERIIRLNELARYQLDILIDVAAVKQLPSGS